MITGFLALLGGFLPGFLFSRLLYKQNKHIRKLSRLGRQKGYHIHHSIWGVIILLTLPFINFQITIELFLSSLSIGIIIDHTLNEGFLFITREANDIMNKLRLNLFFLLLYLPANDEG
jgi:hypothetical protein